MLRYRQEEKENKPCQKAEADYQKAPQTIEKTKTINPPPVGYRHSEQVKQLTKEQAINFFESGAYLLWTPEQLATFQLFQEALCVPFDKFHTALASCLGRPIFTHEFADPEPLRREMFGENPVPSFEDMMAYLPEDKRII